MLLFPKRPIWLMFLLLALLLVGEMTAKTLPYHTEGPGLPLLKVEIPPRPLNWTEVTQNLYYPKFCRQNHIEGTVKIRVLISPQGMVMKLEIVDSPHYDMSVECKKMKALQFKPALDHLGNPVKTWLTIPVTFYLK